jgi:hypothetical protein
VAVPQPAGFGAITIELFSRINRRKSGEFLRQLSETRISGKSSMIEIEGFSH